MTKCFFDNTKLATENISICCFLSNPGPKFTPSSNRLDTGEKLRITSSVNKEVYIRPCISLIRHHISNIYAFSLVYLPLFWWLEMQFF